MQGIKMATAPAKQLHNFPLSLKWGSQSHPYRPDSDSDAEALPSSTRTALPPPPPPPRVGSRSARHHRFSFASCSTSLPGSPKPAKLERSVKRSPSKHPITAPQVNVAGEAEVEEEDESTLRPWNLRPRKQNGNSAFTCVASMEIKEPPVVFHPTTEPKSTRLKGIWESSSVGGCGLGAGGFRVGVNHDGRKEKRKIWIALSREEIEEDVFILTGSRPARRPRKRPKNVQKVLDNVFPGLWLVGATADSYRMADTPVKGR